MTVEKKEIVQYLSFKELFRRLHIFFNKTEYSNDIFKRIESF